MGEVIGLIGIKGGVGKTTISSSLAADLVNSFGKKVLLIDANYSAPNLGLHMDIVKPNKTIHEVISDRAKIKNAIHGRFGVDVVPGSYVFDHKYNPLKLRDKIRRIKKDYDFVIIDSSPSLNEEILSTILASDHLFIVSTLDYPTLSCSLKAIKIARQRGKHIAGIILNKVRGDKFELSLRDIEGCAGLPIVAKIPEDKSNKGALYTRIPASIYSKKSKFTKEISRLNSALTNSEEKSSFINRILSSFRKEQVNRQIFKELFHKKISND